MRRFVEQEKSCLLAFAFSALWPGSLLLLAGGFFSVYGRPRSVLLLGWVAGRVAPPLCRWVWLFVGWLFGVWSVAFCVRACALSGAGLGWGSPRSLAACRLASAVASRGCGRLLTLGRHLLDRNLLV